MLSFNDTWSADKPEGDVLFANTFKSQFLPTPGLVYNNQPTWNPEHRISSWFQVSNFPYWNSKANRILNIDMRMLSSLDWIGAQEQNIL